MNGRAFVALLALAASIPVALAGGYAIGARPDAAPKKEAWIYGAQETYNTGQKGVIVLCQPKTNSRPFANHKRAKPGDIAILTCRAVKEPDGIGG